MLLLAAVATAAEKKVVAYVPNWVDLNSFSETIDYGKLTMIWSLDNDVKGERSLLSAMHEILGTNSATAVPAKKP